MDFFSLESIFLGGASELGISSKIMVTLEFVNDLRRFSLDDKVSLVLLSKFAAASSGEEGVPVTAIMPRDSVTVANDLLFAFLSVVSAA